ncbi:MAG: DegT/DnrJ/EryC1/StrS family aminotransferase [Desulfovibrionaceae bacterium]|nr:DegT/DnrJ/EryC1/StrS family aminotransferase [Desulfovibrionaceae bacterium]
MDCVRDIFASRQLTNQGSYAARLQQSLADFLGVPSLSLCANGTLALQLALRCLGLNGKTVITTPFTYVATLSALLWEGCTPVFADIDPRSLCLDPAGVERCLKEHPGAAGILPVHVYGNACDVDALADIAGRRGLCLLYDAAHAFGSTLRGTSLFAFGDAAVGSFHATKLFHTVEGGCVVSSRADANDTLSLLRAFGHVGDTHKCLGINAKMSELHAAMGLCLLPSVPDGLARRARLTALYDEALGVDETMNGVLRRPALAPDLAWNHAYYPVIFPDHGAAMRVMRDLAERNIHPRRYFYPSLTRLPYIQGASCPIAEDIAERVLCLPFWPDMDEDLVRKIAGLVRESLRA